ncbi:MAG: hypothetical protein ACJ789_05550 [Thermomicrobiales bacterium]
MATDPHAVYEGPQAEAYEKYVRENWEKLAPWEQQQAREFMVGSKHPRRVSPSGAASPSLPKSFLNADKGDQRHPELVWTIKAGWVFIILALLLSPLLFGILGVGVGVYNAKKGEPETGVLQVGLTILAVVLAILIYLAGSEILGSFMPNPAGPFG